MIQNVCCEGVDHSKMVLNAGLLLCKVQRPPDLRPELPQGRGEHLLLPPNPRSVCVLHLMDIDNDSLLHQELKESLCLSDYPNQSYSLPFYLRLRVRIAFVLSQDV